MKYYLLAIVCIALFALPAHAQIKIDALTITPAIACAGDIVVIEGRTSGPVSFAKLLGPEKEPFIVYMQDTMFRLYVRAFKSHTYTLTIYDAVGGYYSDTASLSVNKCSATSVASTEKENDISVYPNPCTNELRIRCIGPSSALLCDITSKSIMHAKGTDNLIFQTKDLPSGMYVVQVISVDFPPRMFKVLKQ
jgi:hypothetical protein